MLREIKKNGSPEPTFHTDKDRTFFLVEVPVHPVSAEASKSTPEVTTEVTTEVKRLPGKNDQALGKLQLFRSHNA